jgi:hypothetical protein
LGLRMFIDLKGDDFKVCLYLVPKCKIWILNSLIFFLYVKWPKLYYTK